MKAFEIITPGSYTTVQDKGRFGYQYLGVPVSGALDQRAASAANYLVGNTDDAAVLETTFIGPKMKALSEMDVAITGADCTTILNDKPVNNWQTVRVMPGDILNVGQVRSGCRSYIAITGGVDSPVIMGSRSFLPAAGIGSPLAKAAIINRLEAELLKVPRMMKFHPVYGNQIELRAIKGPQDDLFDVDAFFSSEFVVGPDSNRMGYRLIGKPIKGGKGIISEASLPGAVQILPNGQAVILLVEQTIGGYTKIATVISEDISKIGQAKPGDKISFLKL